MDINKRILFPLSDEQHTFSRFWIQKIVLSIKRSTFTSSKFERTHLITIEQRLNSIKTVKSVKMCSVTAKVNGQRLESCEHLKISHSTWLLGMMEVGTRPGHGNVHSWT